MLHIEQVSKRYGSITALDAASLSVASGTLSCVHGPSGCGKTTLLLCCAGLLQADSGTIHIQEQPVHSMSQQQRTAFRAAHIGFVFQQFHLIPYLTARQNILAAGLGLNKKCDEQRADELLNYIGLEQRAAHKPHEMSAGQCQRIALARALFHRPAVILADEPTGNLDPNTGAEIIDLLLDYAKHAAILVASHDQHIADKATTCLQMEHGRINA